MLRYLIELQRIEMLQLPTTCAHSFIYIDMPKVWLYIVHSMFNIAQVDTYMCPHTYVKIGQHKLYIYMCPHKFQRLIHMLKYVHLAWSHM